MSLPFADSSGSLFKLSVHACLMLVRQGRLECLAGREQLINDSQRKRLFIEIQKYSPQLKEC